MPQVAWPLLQASPVPLNLEDFKADRELPPFDLCLQLAQGISWPRSQWARAKGQWDLAGAAVFDAPGTS